MKLKFCQEIATLDYKNVIKMEFEKCTIMSGFYTSGHNKQNIYYTVINHL